MGVASEYEKWRQRLIATNRYDGYVKAATEHSCKSQSDKDQMLLEKEVVELLQKYKREVAKKRRLQRDKKRKQEDNAWKRGTQYHKPSRVACSAAVNQLKQANKEASVEAKEEKTALVDTTEHVEEAEDKNKPAAVQRVEPNEVKKHQSILQKMWSKKKTKSQQQKIGQCNNKRQIYRDKKYLHRKLF